VLDLYEELVALIGALEDRGIEYALCGGLALAVWGLPRATVDIDLFIQPDAVDAVEAVAESLGYHFKARPMTFSSGAIVIRRVTKLDPIGGDPLMLDMLLVTPATRDVWESRERVAWERGTISVVSRSGLVKLKSFRGSGTDLDDIRKLQEAE
jgi:Nucleotidyl transferase AbiEii toxin, Type IV TA system